MVTTRTINLYRRFFTADELGEVVGEPLPQLNAQDNIAVDDANLDFDAYNRGSVMLHELVHWVTGSDRQLLGQQFQRLYPDLEENDYHGAEDLSPADWIVEGTDVCIHQLGEYFQTSNSVLGCTNCSSSSRALSAP